METSSMITEINRKDNYRIVKILDESVRFCFIQNQKIIKTIVLNPGIHKISSAYFLRQVPSEAEVEYAINEIEDELMSNKELLNTNEALFISDRFIIEIVNMANKPLLHISRQAIEEIFTQYALVSMGRSPIYDDIKMDKDKYAGLLILREIMHHLDFNSITILNG